MIKTIWVWLTIGYLVCAQHTLADEQNVIQTKYSNGMYKWQMQLETKPVRLQLFNKDGIKLLEHDLHECTSESLIERKLIVVPTIQGPNLLVDCRSRDNHTLLFLSATQVKPIAQFTQTSPIFYQVEPGAISIRTAKKIMRWPEGPTLPVTLLHRVAVQPNTEMRFGPNTVSPLVAVMNNPLQVVSISPDLAPSGWLLTRSDAGLLGYVHESTIVQADHAKPAGLDWYFSEDPELNAFLTKSLEVDMSGLAQVKAPAAGAWLSKADLNGDNSAELLVMPNHSCSNIACELMILQRGSSGYQLLGRTLTYGTPRLSGHRRHGWQSLVRFDLGEGPNCCAPRVAIEFSPDKNGNWRDLGLIQQAVNFDWKLP